MSTAPHIKICGLRELEHALAAALRGADFLGLVFAPSRRQVTVAQAKKVISHVRNQSSAVPMFVGVFVNAPAEQVNQVAEECQLDYVQLSGRESWAYTTTLSRPVIKVIHMDEAGIGPEGLATLAKTCAEARLRGHVVMLDSGSDRQPGGTGKTFDWSIAAELAHQFQFLLAGGLTPNNVEEAIELVHPWGVDVSSGVETAGAKDIKKIEDFIAAVQRSRSLR
jgi:phosphoribosylanthranilate isomerase